MLKTLHLFNKRVERRVFLIPFPKSLRKLNCHLNISPAISIKIE